MRSLFFVLLLVIIGCSNEPAQSQVGNDPGTKSVTGSAQKITHYSQVPAYIKNFLSSRAADSFKIADPGKPWAGGCMRLGSEPYRQLIEGILHKDAFVMRYRVGGIATIEHEIRIQLQGQTITGYSLDGQPGPQSL